MVRSKRSGRILNSKAPRILVRPGEDCSDACQAHRGKQKDPSSCSVPTARKGRNDNDCYRCREQHADGGVDCGMGEYFPRAGDERFGPLFGGNSVFKSHFGKHPHDSAEDKKCERGQTSPEERVSLWMVVGLEEDRGKTGGDQKIRGCDDPGQLGWSSVLEQPSHAREFITRGKAILRAGRRLWPRRGLRANGGGQRFP